MTSSLSRRWLLAALFLAFLMPLGAWAQTLDIDVTPNIPVTVNAGEATPAGFGLLNTTGGVLNNIEIQVGALPTGVTWGTCPINDGYDISNLGTTGLVTLASLADAASANLLCDLEVAPDVAAATVFNIAAFWTFDVGVTDTSADITVEREVDIRVLISEAVGGAPYSDPAVAGSNDPNANANYFVRVRNFGPSDATNIVIDTSTTLPADVVVDSITEQTGTYAGDASGNGQWTIPSLAFDAATALELYLVVGPSAPEGTNDLTLSAALNAVDETETGEPEQNSDLAETGIVRETAFTLTVACTPDNVIAGSGAGNLECTVDLGQTGPSDASGVAVDLTLPAGVTVDSADTTGAPGTSWTSPTWTVDDAPVGYTGSIVLTMTVDDTASGDLDIVAAVTANETVTNGPVTGDDIVVAESAAGAPTTFLTTIGFTNGYPGEVTVMISCNNGSPLEQDFEISVGTPVDFVVELLDFVAPDVNCEVTLAAVDDGYVGGFLANGVDTGDSCFFASEPDVDQAPFDGSAERMNTCEITAEPVSSTFEVEKLWAFEGDDVIGLVAGIDIWCEPASATTGPDYGTVSTFVYAEGDAEFGLTFYPHWNGETTCYAEEGGLDSSVESDQGCLDGTDFVIGDDDQGCTITNTVFFEGIPTLSQYGLALMALLMLGVGFIGLRRFV